MWDYVLKLLSLLISRSLLSQKSSRTSRNHAQDKSWGCSVMPNNRSEIVWNEFWLLSIITTNFMWTVLTFQRLYLSTDVHTYVIWVSKISISCIWSQPLIPIAAVSLIRRSATTGPLLAMRHITHGIGSFDSSQDLRARARIQNSNTVYRICL